MDVHAGLGIGFFWAMSASWPPMTTSVTGSPTPSRPFIAFDQLGARSQADWRWDGLVSEATWDHRREAASDQHKPWADTLQRRFTAITDLSARLVSAWRTAADDVITHRDFEPSDVLITAAGPALIDWDSVGNASATLEAGCVAVFFSLDPERIRRVLEGYRSAGGHLADLQGDLLLQPIARRLSDLGSQITIALGERPLHRNRNDSAALDRTLSREIEDLLEQTAFLMTIGRSLCEAAPRGRPSRKPRT